MVRIIVKSYNSGKDLFNDTWQYGTKSQKVRVLKSVGAHPSFAITKSPYEMVQRGGGLGVRSVGRLMDEYVKRNPNKTIRWSVK